MPAADSHEPLDPSFRLDLRRDLPAFRPGLRARLLLPLGIREAREPARILSGAGVPRLRRSPGARRGPRRERRGADVCRWLRGNGPDVRAPRAPATPGESDRGSTPRLA